jgi:DNA-binding response OmpR family regulator
MGGLSKAQECVEWEWEWEWSEFFPAIVLISVSLARETGYNGSTMAAKILVVDDERPIADTLTTIFRSVGYEAYTAYDGLLGLEAARTLHPDLIFTDVTMPGLDGVSMAMEIRRTLPTTAVLLFSGQASTVDLLRQAEEKGFHFELLAKPMPPGEILSRVAAAVSCPGNPCRKAELGCSGGNCTARSGRVSIVNKS